MRAATARRFRTNRPPAAEGRPGHFQRPVAAAGFTEVYEELLEVALTEGIDDDGALATLLDHLIGNIQYSGLLAWNDPALPMLITTQLPPEQGLS